ncbi:MAG: threonine/serine dehydratase [Vicinamibacterales bacterium]
MTPSPEAIAATGRLIRPHVRCTPLLTLTPGDLALTEAPLTLKLEQLQHAGSFKVRGAFAHLLERPIPPVGVAAASGGNHGAAVAYAASRLGMRATIFVPSIAAPSKLDRIRRYGAELVVGGDRYADALEHCDAFVARSGALPVHAYDALETLLGAGTLGEELDAQDANLDTLLVAVGGGGLIGGLAAWFRGRIRIIGVEPTGAPTLAHARAAGRPVDAPVGGVAADSLGARRVGALMFPLAQAFVSDIVLVENDEIRQAQAVLWDRLRLVTEPGGAAAFAALLAGRVRPTERERVGVLLCGANTDPASIAGPPSP